jgi:hypothetical protein
MTTIEKAITGNELKECTTQECDKYIALVEFYEAFNNQSMKLMQNNWHNNENIAMDNPLGGIKRGWDEISNVYERIFNANARVYVEFFDYTIIEIDGGFVAVGRERGNITTANSSLDLKIRTSRVYKRIDGVYKQVHHHGSIEYPELLKKYQDLVK